MTHRKEGFDLIYIYCFAFVKIHKLLSEIERPVMVLCFEQFSVVPEGPPAARGTITFDIPNIYKAI